MRSLRQPRPGAGKRQPLNLRSLTVAVGTGLLLAAGLLSTSACGAGPTIPDRFIYVTNQLDNTLSVIDGSAYKVVATVPAGAFPAGVAASPDGRHAYIAQGGDDAVAVFDTSTNTITKIVSLAPGSKPRGVTLTPMGNSSTSLTAAPTASRSLTPEPISSWRPCRSAANGECGRHT